MRVTPSGGVLLSAAELDSLADAMLAVPDPRKRQGQRHRIDDLLALIVAGMLTGSRTLYAVTEWFWSGEAAQVLDALDLRRVELPSHTTLWRLLRQIDLPTYEAALGGWLQAHATTDLGSVAVDEAELRGLHGELLPGVQLVAAFVSATATRGDTQGTVDSRTAVGQAS